MELFIILFAGIGMMLFFGARKQKKMVQAQTELQDSLSEGDRVMTTAGLYATVADASDDTTIDLEIDDGVITTWLRQAIREKVGPTEDEDADVLDTEDTDGDSAEDAESEDDSAADTDAESDIESDTESDDDNSARQSSGAQVAPPLEHK